MEKFKQVQYAMTQFLRDPENKPAPEGIESRRLTIYKDLIFNNIKGFLDNGFPVLRSLVSEQEWNDLVREFVIKHQCKSPLFQDISYEFVQFLPQSAELLKQMPFAVELAHYEWVELAVIAGENESYQDAVAVNSFDDLVDNRLIFSENAWLLAYEYPVNQISAENIPTQKPSNPTLIMVYRDKKDDVNFMLLQPATFVFGQLLEAGELEMMEIINTISEQFKLEVDIVRIEITKTIREWSEKGIILNTCEL